MRRVLIFLTSAVLMLASLGIGMFAADLPFWRRAFEWPPQPDGIYLPAAEIGNTPPNAAAEPAALDPAVDVVKVDEAVTHARNAGSRALLVMHRGRLQLERYFGADESDTLMPAGLVSRPLAAMAAGVALADGHIRSLDVPVAHFLHEWEGEARGAITLRQLLEDTSGLETGGDVRMLLDGSAWTDPALLPRFATSPGVRLLLGNDFESAALGFQLDHEPGGFHNVSPANIQLVAVILERATGMPYERYLAERLWGPAGAGRALLQLDRRAGMPAAHCCWRAAARDMLRMVSLLASDGTTSGTRVLPAGWAREMASPSRVSAGTGMQVQRSVINNAAFLSAMDADGNAFWVAPEPGLVIVNIAGDGGGSAPQLPELLLSAFVP
jgi:CubicO group peptidase (beta-lactamase class C family)